MAPLDIKITLSTSRFQSWGMVASGADTFLMLTTLLSALNNLVCLGIISWAVDTLKGQHGSTAEEVHSCRTAVLTHDTVSALQHFSLQLIHSSPQLSVGGFFAVDRSFLLVLIGNLATYLVILLQFRGT
ncbi:putative gustatory receptor 28a [Penaeus vannamei]|uniref:putative gustatory receptor 28a n=1 Tax=Penaeus vannamei TaxID=6689 RepID=UPI00387F5C4E